MKQWVRVLAIILFAALLFPNVLEVNAAKVDSLKGDSHFVNSFAMKDGGIYYVNNGYMQDKPFGIYKVSRDMKTFRLIKKGQFTNIQLYQNSIVTFNDDENMLQRYSFDGKLIREFPQVTGSDFSVEKDVIYYHTGNNMYQIGINGKGRKHLLSTKGYIQEFTVHNGWLYFVTSVQIGNEYDMRYTSTLSKIKIASPKKVHSLVSNVNNIDSILVRDGYIYSTIHKTSNIDGRPLYRMDYSGNNLKRISTINTTATFVGSKYIYYIDNGFGDTHKLFRTTLDGKNTIKAGELPGRKVSAEYHNGDFLFEVQNIKKQRLFLHRIQQKF